MFLRLLEKCLEFNKWKQRFTLRIRVYLMQSAKVENVMDYLYISNTTCNHLVRKDKIIYYGSVTTFFAPFDCVF